MGSGRIFPLIDISRKARLKVIEVSRRTGAVHFGGIFSIIDFLIAFYSFSHDINVLDEADASITLNSDLFHDLYMSKGHCYLAQLAAIDSLFSDTDLCKSYLSKTSGFFAHPKRNDHTKIFPVSSGSLGQGIAMANGTALAKQLRRSKEQTWSIIGDGELNEGVVNEVIQFSAQRNLNHVIVIDNNKQESLDFTVNIVNNGDLKTKFSCLKVHYFEADGHDVISLVKMISEITTLQGSVIVNLLTIKGKGISFMERIPHWHSRRLKDDEWQKAMKELGDLDA
jgi:transketolase